MSPKGPAAVRVLSITIAALLVPLGLGSKRYEGPGSEWVVASAGDLLVVIFIAFLVKAALPRARPLAITVGVTAFAFAVEFFQLYSPPWLEGLRGSTLGDLTLGSTFDPHDLLYYVIGSALGFVALRLVDRRLLRATARGSAEGDGARRSPALPGPTRRHGGGR